MLGSGKNELSFAMESFSAYVCALNLTIDASLFPRVVIRVSSVSSHAKLAWPGTNLCSQIGASEAGNSDGCALLKEQRWHHIGERPQL